MCESEFLNIFGSAFLPDATPEERSSWFVSLDYDANGIVGWDEFCTFLMSTKHTPTVADTEEHAYSKIPALYEGKGHREGITHIIHNTTTDVYYSAGMDGAVYLWSPTSLACSGRLVHQCPPGAQINDMRWVPSLNRLYVLQSDTTLSVYDCGVLGRGRDGLTKLLRGVDGSAPRDGNGSAIRHRPQVQRVVESVTDASRQGFTPDLAAVLRGKAPVSKGKGGQGTSAHSLAALKARLAHLAAGDSEDPPHGGAGGAGCDSVVQSYGDVEEIPVERDVQLCEALPLYELSKPALTLDYATWAGGGSYFIGTDGGTVNHYSAKKVESIDYTTPHRATKWRVHSPSEYVTRVQAVPCLDGFISSSTDETVQLFNIEKCASYVRLHDETCVTPVHGGARRSNKGVFGFDYSPELNLLATWGENRKFVIWNPLTATCLYHRMEHMRSLTQVMFKPNYQLISVSIDKTIKIWDTRTFRCVQTLVEKQSKLRDEQFRCLTWDNERQTIVTGGTEPVLFRMQSVQERVEAGINVHRQLQGHVRPVLSVLVLPTSGHIATIDRDSVVTWELATGHRVALWYPEFLEGGQHKLTTACVSMSDRRLILCCDNGSLYLVNCMKKIILRVCHAADTEVMSCLCLTPRHGLTGPEDHLICAGTTTKIAVFRDELKISKIGSESKPLSNMSLENYGHALALSFVAPARLIVGTSKGLLVLFSLSNMTLVSVGNEPDMLASKGLSHLVTAVTGGRLGGAKFLPPQQQQQQDLPASTPATGQLQPTSRGTASAAAPPAVGSPPQKSAQFTLPAAGDLFSAVVSEPPAAGSQQQQQQQQQAPHDQLSAAGSPSVFRDPSASWCTTSSGVAASPLSPFPGAASPLNEEGCSAAHSGEGATAPPPAAAAPSKTPNILRSVLAKTRNMNGVNEFTAFQTLTQRYTSLSVEGIAALNPSVFATVHGNGDLCIWRLKRDPHQTALFLCVPGSYSAGDSLRTVVYSEGLKRILVGDDEGYVSVFDPSEPAHAILQEEAAERRTAAATAALLTTSSAASGVPNGIRRESSTSQEAERRRSHATGGAGGAGFGQQQQRSSSRQRKRKSVKMPGLGKTRSQAADHGMYLTRCYRAHQSAVNMMEVVGGGSGGGGGGGASRQGSPGDGEGGGGGGGGGSGASPIYILTGGTDCLVKVWSCAGAHLATFGNRGGWCAELARVFPAPTSVEAQAGGARAKGLPGGEGGGGPADPPDIDPDTREAIKTHYFAVKHPKNIRGDGGGAGRGSGAPAAARQSGQATTLGDVFASGVDTLDGAAGEDAPSAPLSMNVSGGGGGGGGGGRVVGGGGGCRDACDQLPTIPQRNASLDADLNVQRMLSYSMKKTADPELRRYGLSRNLELQMMDRSTENRTFGNLEGTMQLSIDKVRERQKGKNPVSSQYSALQLPRPQLGIRLKGRLGGPPGAPARTDGAAPLPKLDRKGGARLKPLNVRNEPVHVS